MGWRIGNICYLASSNALLKSSWYRGAASFVLERKGLLSYDKTNLLGKG